MQAARKTPIRLAGFQLVLYEVEKLRFDNGRMAVRHIILRHFALVDLLLFGEEIHREFLLQERVALVLFVGEDALHHLGPPHLFAARSGNTLVGEVTSPQQNSGGPEYMGSPAAGALHQRRKWDRPSHGHDPLGQVWPLAPPGRRLCCAGTPRRELLSYDGPRK